MQAEYLFKSNMLHALGVHRRVWCCGTCRSGSETIHSLFKAATPNIYHRLCLSSCSQIIYIYYIIYTEAFAKQRVLF